MRGVDRLEPEGLEVDVALGGVVLDQLGDDALDVDQADDKTRKETGSLLQVSDGSVLWSYWVNGDSKNLSRRNIGEIIEAAGQVESYTPARTLQDLGVGGLQTLTSQMQVGMAFIAM